MSGSSLRASLVLIVLAFMVAGGLACGADAPLTPAGTTDVDAITPAATQVPMPVATATAVPTATATAMPVVPDGKSRTAPIPRGQSVTHDDFKLTITDVSYSTAGEGFLAELEEGHVWAYVSLRIESMGDPDKTYSYNTINFRMVGSRGVIYDDWVSKPRGDLGSGEVFGGGVVEGTVIRQVHKDDTDLVLIYSPTFSGSVYLALGTDPNDGISMGVVASDPPMATATDTPAPMATAAPTATDTPAPMATAAPTATDTPAPMATAAPTATDTPAPMATAAPTATNTPAPMATAAPTATNTPAPMATAAPTATNTPAPMATAAPTATNTPAPMATATNTPIPKPWTQFGDGTWIAGTDIVPGVYSAPGGSGCYWERLSGFSGGFGDIIANDSSSGGRQIVAINANDAGFSTNNCGEWIPLSESFAPTTTLSDGMWVVGDEVDPGVYSAPGGSGCYWERLSGFSGEFGDIIANDSSSGGRQIVAINANDAGFSTNNCGEWIPLSESFAPTTTLSDGMWVVGDEVDPGVYSAPGGSGCYWERLSGFSGEFGDIIANDSSSGGRQIVAINANDAGFSTNNCGEWIPLSESFAPTTTLSDGMWVVGDEVDPGVYSAPGGSGCYWERLSGFSGEFGDIIANDSSSGGRQIVAINANDAGFSTNNCGEWTQTATP